MTGMRAQVSILTSVTAALCLCACSNNEPQSQQPGVPIVPIVSGDTAGKPTPVGGQPDGEDTAATTTTVERAPTETPEVTEPEPAGDTTTTAAAPPSTSAATTTTVARPDPTPEATTPPAPPITLFEPKENSAVTEFGLQPTDPNYNGPVPVAVVRGNGVGASEEFELRPHTSLTVHVEVVDGERLRFALVVTSGQILAAEQADSSREFTWDAVPPGTYHLEMIGDADWTVTLIEQRTDSYGSWDTKVFTGSGDYTSPARHLPNPPSGTLISAEPATVAFHGADGSVGHVTVNDDGTWTITAVTAADGTDVGAWPIQEWTMQVTTGGQYRVVLD